MIQGRFAGRLRAITRADRQRTITLAPTWAQDIELQALEFAAPD